MTYTLLTLLLPFGQLLGWKKFKALGLKVEAFNFRTIQFLFGEIFVRSEYYFKAETSAPIIVDCGSNIGFSVLFLKFLYPDSTVYAFEPDPTTFTLLKRNIKANGLKKVVLYNAAVGERDGTTNFYVDDLAGNMTMSLVKERLEGKAIKVKVMSLSKFAQDKNIDFMKMDIEGYEQEVLRDLAKTQSLDRFKEMTIEYHHLIDDRPLGLAELLQSLENGGFRYKLDTASVPIYSKDKFQDILIFAYRKQLNKLSNR